MIDNFLYKCKTEILEKKENCKREINDLNLKLKESIYYLNEFQSISDDNYNSFSPRKIVTDNDNKIEFYNNKIKNIKLYLKQKAEEIGYLETQISEIDELIYFNNQSNQLIVNESNNENSEEFRIKILEAQEFERKRIARDLHDSIIQNLTYLVHKVELSSKLIDIDLIRSRLELVSMEKSIRDTIDEIRKIIFNLYPITYDDIGLDVFIKNHLDKISEVGNLNISFEVEGNERPVKSIIGLTLVRIVQEIFNNIIKHSNADNAIILLRYNQNYIEVKISDDGIGFDLKNANIDDGESLSGFGIPMMKERVYLLSGTINIESELNKGTLVYIRVPA